MQNTSQGYSLMSRICHKLNKYWYDFLIIILLIQIPFQNFFLNQTALGVFGSNMSLIAINFFFVIILLARLNYLKIYKKYLIVFLMYMVITFVFLLFSGFYIKSLNLIAKTLNNIIFYSQPFIVFYIFNYLYKINSRLIKISISMSLYIFLFLLLYLILNAYGIFTLDTNPILHGIENGNMRLRLFSSESSMAATVFITFGIIASMRFDNIYFKSFIILCILYGSVLLQSKGAFLILLIICMWSLKFLKLHHKIFLIFLITSLLALSLNSIMNYLLNIQLQIEKYTSFSTRLTAILAAIISLFYYPLGSGFGAYLTFFDANIIEAKKITEIIFSCFGLVPNFSEVDSYLSSAAAYCAKTMLFNSIMFFGWLGLMLFVYLHYQIYRKIGINPTLKLLFLYLLLSHVLFVDSLYLYHFWFAFALIYNYWRIDVKKNINYSK